MTTAHNSAFELSKLTIDRSAQVKTPWLPVNISSTTIAFLMLGSVFILSHNLLFPESNGKAKQSVAAQEVLVNKPVNKHVQANRPVQPRSNSFIETQPIQTALDASGHIVARRIATVSSRVTGKLNVLNIEEGQRVNKREVLAELDDKQATISHRLALSELSAKKAEYEEFALLFNQQNKHVNRNKSLASQQLISQQRLEDSEFRQAQLAIKIRNKQALLELAKQRVELAKYQLEQHKIRAPFGGVVIRKNAQVGELISAGSSGGGFIRTGVGTIVDMSSLEIEVEVGESYINRVYSGQKVIAKLDAYPNWPIDSEVVAVIPTADRQKASIKVRVKIFSEDQRILPDMGVKVSFIKAKDIPSEQAEVAAL